MKSVSKSSHSALAVNVPSVKFPDLRTVPILKPSLKEIESGLIITNMFFQSLLSLEP